jgi:hypothetical protein
MMIELLKKLLILSLFFFAFASAETVVVDVKGDVDLEAFNCSKTNSVLIKRACYKPDDAYFLVQIKDNWFQHCSVQPKIFDALMQAKSFNRFYKEKIKGKFSCYH